MLNRFRIFSINTRCFSSTPIFFRQKTNNDPDVYEVQINNEHREFHNLFTNKPKSRSTTEGFHDEKDDFTAVGVDRSASSSNKAIRGKATRNQNFGFHSNDGKSKKFQKFADGTYSTGSGAAKSSFANSNADRGKPKANDDFQVFSKAKLIQKNEGDDLFGDDGDNLTIVGADKFNLTKLSNKDDDRPTNNVVSMKKQIER